MVTWIFLYVALNGPHTKAFSVGFDSKEVCTAYAEGFKGKQINAQGVRVAECVGLRTGEVVDYVKPKKKLPPQIESLRSLYD